MRLTRKQISQLAAKHADEVMSKCIVDNQYGYWWSVAFSNKYEELSLANGYKQKR